MSKPAIFISHSSKDQAIVRALSDALRKKTGGAVEIFVSSDGQSIPLGRNWVHSIEQALDRASLMFVLLSPNSIGSQWIYFEAGYSYSQKRRVIPIGIPGVDLGVLAPPMSLLQGFNVTSPESLNNLLVLINKEFEHSHDAVFSQADYDAIFGHVQRRADPLLQEFADWLEFLRVRVRLPFNALRPHIERVYKSAKIDTRAGEYEILGIGATFRRQYQFHDRELPDEQRMLDVYLDPSRAMPNLHVLQQAIASYVSEAGLDAVPEVGLSLFFAHWVNHVKEMHRLTAKLPGSAIRFGEHNDFVFRGRSFYLSRGTDYDNPEIDHLERTELSLYLPANELTRFDVLGLLRTLYHHNILFMGNLL